MKQVLTGISQDLVHLLLFLVLQLMGFILWIKVLA